MFELIFKNTLSDSHNTALVNNLWEEIAVNYSAPGRYYHTIHHLDHLSIELTRLRKEIKDWQTIIAAVAYHDIVYDPLNHDNEERSADVASDRLTQLGWASSQINKCKEQIMATKHHNKTGNADTNFLTDADLSILGSDSTRYIEYTRQIRKEYDIYPDDIYCAGRKKVLAHLLNMRPIFKTAHFRSLYEEQAAVNMMMELATLT